MHRGQHKCTDINITNTNSNNYASMQKQHITKQRISHRISLNMCERKNSKCMRGIVTKEENMATNFLII